jgi:multidrug resistance efflux pump
MLGTLRGRVLPWVIWLGTMGAVASMWQTVHDGAARGFVVGVSYEVAAPQAGLIATLLVDVGQRVDAGQAVATLDARELAVELEILAAERGRVEAELVAVAAETRASVGETSRGIEESVGAAERALAVARADREVRVDELSAMRTQASVLTELVERRMADRRELDALAVQQAPRKKQLQTDQALIAQLAGQAAAARARREDIPRDGIRQATEPLRAELAVLRGREQLLALRQAALTLRAPADGEVTALHLRPGELVAAGAPVLAIGASGGLQGPSAARVLVCLGEPQAARVQPGEAALLRPTGPDERALAAHVTHLAPQVAELPLRCRRDPQLPEWGRAAYLALDDPALLLPGQSFAVQFLGRPAPRVDEPAPPPPHPPPGSELVLADVPTGPVAMAVPPALLARTRFEPSALVWAPRLDRFVVVSDDTGLAGQGEHAPWLFTMDTHGCVDPEPLVLAGVDQLSDLESIAAAPDGGLYLLASQSHSRKGKRPRARQRFVHVALHADGARATAVVQLARLLDEAGGDALPRLGLASTAELEIEGMTATAEGGLLLGLKAPLGPQGQALIWHLRRPDELLATGDLAAGELTLWGQIPLGITADGAPVTGGIADLLELGDGSLLVATTASSGDPAVQDGALVHAVGRAGLADPRPVRVFPGLKPEGLARNSSGTGVVVVFDASADTPRWMEQPWPALR